jgi:hypothetical protein
MIFHNWEVILQVKEEFVNSIYNLKDLISTMRYINAGEIDKLQTFIKEFKGNLANLECKQLYESNKKSEFYKEITPKAEKTEEIFIAILKVAIKNIEYLYKEKEYKEIEREAYHVHNIPQIIIHIYNMNKGIIEYYANCEALEYKKTTRKELSEKFVDLWNLLDELIKEL